MPRTRSSAESSSLSEGEVSDAMTASNLSTNNSNVLRKRKAESASKQTKNSKKKSKRTCSDDEVSLNPDCDDLDGDLGSPGPQTVDQSNLTAGSGQSEAAGQTPQSVIQANPLDPQQIQMIVAQGMPALLRAVREDPETRQLFVQGLTGVANATAPATINVTNTACVRDKGQTSRKQGNNPDRDNSSHNSNVESVDSEVFLFHRCLQKEPGLNPASVNDDASNVLNSSDETDRQLVLERFVTQSAEGHESINPDNSDSIADMRPRSVVDAGREQDNRGTNKSNNRQKSGDTANQDLARNRARDAVREAENAQVRLLHPPGERELNIEQRIDQGLRQLRVNAAPVQAGPSYKPKRAVSFASQVAVAGSSNSELSDDDDSDDDYHIYAHVDDKTIEAIKAGEFVEINKVAPNATVEVADDGKLQMVNVDGKIGVEAAARNTPSIGNYQQWQSAFRVFSAIYQKAFPGTGIELLEYEHNIQNASRHFIWPNVAVYDRLFRKRVARKFKKGKKVSWADKYAKAWDFELQEKLAKPYNLFSPRGNGGSQPANNTSTPTTQKREICLFFNKTGKCRYGSKCHRDHRCLNCGARGHGMVNCYKLKKTDDDHKK